MDLLRKTNGTKVFIKATRASWELQESETVLFQAGEQCLDMPLCKFHTCFSKGLPTYKPFHQPRPTQFLLVLMKNNNVLIQGQLQPLSVPAWC